MHRGGGPTSHRDQGRSEAQDGKGQGQDGKGQVHRGYDEGDEGVH